MWVDRRGMVNLGLGLGTVLTAAAATTAAAGPRSARSPTAAGAPAELIAGGDQPITEQLQRAIDEAAAAGRELRLPPGRLLAGPLTLRAGSRLTGTPGATTLAFVGGGHFIRASKTAGIRLAGLVLDGGGLPLDPARADGLVTLADCPGLELCEITVRNSLLHGISLIGCSGRIADCAVSHCGATGIRSLDATGLTIAHNTVADCGNNGIQIWRSQAGEDASLVTANRIERIAARAGGSGQNGNGINVFRAGGVLVSNNRISDCAYSAVRGNAASNIQIVANSCARLGEVALYAEFGFEGAMFANNVVDGAGSGIEVTNFDQGGRLAIIQGNLIRNLLRREQEPVDKRGDGIGVEADAVVSGNIVENAPTAGIVIGWGHHMRSVMATGNLIRNARIGIMVTADPTAGPCLVSGNMIIGATNGAVRGMDHGVAVGGDLTVAKPARLVNVTVAGNVVG